MSASSLRACARAAAGTAPTADDSETNAKVIILVHEDDALLPAALCCIVGYVSWRTVQGTLNLIEHVPGLGDQRAQPSSICFSLHGCREDRVRQERRRRGWVSRWRGARYVFEIYARTFLAIFPTFDAILIDEAQDLIIAPNGLRVF